MSEARAVVGEDIVVFEKPGIPSKMSTFEKKGKLKKYRVLENLREKSLQRCGLCRRLAVGSVRPIHMSRKGDKARVRPRAFLSLRMIIAKTR